jgi:hypothetical protein
MRRETSGGGQDAGCRVRTTAASSGGRWRVSLGMIRDLAITERGDRDLRVVCTVPQLGGGPMNRWDSRLHGCAERRLRGTARVDADGVGSSGQRRRVFGLPQPKQRTQRGEIPICGGALLSSTTGSTRRKDVRRGTPNRPTIDQPTVRRHAMNDDEPARIGSTGTSREALSAVSLTPGESRSPCRLQRVLSSAVHTRISFSTRPPTSVSRNGRPLYVYVSRSWSMPSACRIVACKSLTCTRSTAAL